MHVFIIFIALFLFLCQNACWFGTHSRNKPSNIIFFNSSARNSFVDIRRYRCQQTISMPWQTRLQQQGMVMGFHCSFLAEKLKRYWLASLMHKQINSSGRWHVLNLGFVLMVLNLFQYGRDKSILSLNQECCGKRNLAISSHNTAILCRKTYA